MLIIYKSMSSDVRFFFYKKKLCQMYGKICYLKKEKNRVTLSQSHIIGLQFHKSC